MNVIYDFMIDDKKRSTQLPKYLLHLPFSHRSPVKSAVQMQLGREVLNPNMVQRPLLRHCISRHDLEDGGGEAGG